MSRMGSNQNYLKQNQFLMPSEKRQTELDRLGEKGIMSPSFLNGPHLSYPGLNQIRPSTTVWIIKPW